MTTAMENQMRSRGATLPTRRPIVILESPFAGDVIRNTLYLRKALRHSYSLGEHPIASHGFYPFFLNESDPAQREDGILFGYRFWDNAEKIVFYTDLGWSSGMERARTRLDVVYGGTIPSEIRTIGVE